ncbi:MAG: hemin receptor, partial [Prevotellaceae bacterium]|nr:hemin receptor [Prevotellaceae bacterium]
MNTKYIVVAVLASLMALPVAAQETYQDTKLIDNDLNGTARYVGMGGAMEALGADISTISTNPAGLGLMRKGQVSLTGGLVLQSGVSNDLRYRDIGVRINGNQTNASFDQIGIVYPVRFMGQSRLTLGFNYHKSRNFDQILSAGGALSNASQGKLSAIKYDKVGEWGWNGVDANYQRLFEKTGEDGKKTMDYYNGTAYLFGQYQKGYIGEYDFNMSGSINDRVYLGLTVGLHDVNYRSYSIYT